MKNKNSKRNDKNGAGQKRRLEKRETKKESMCQVRKND